MIVLEFSSQKVTPPACGGLLLLLYLAILALPEQVRGGKTTWFKAQKAERVLSHWQPEGGWGHRGTGVSLPDPRKSSHLPDPSPPHLPPTKRPVAPELTSSELCAAGGRPVMVAPLSRAGRGGANWKVSACPVIGSGLNGVEKYRLTGFNL